MAATHPIRWITRALLGAALAAATCAATASPNLRHGQLPPPGLGGPIELVDQRGQPFSLAQLAGRPVLLFFGFTRCGSTCPVALATARQLLAEPGPAPTAIVFVTLDPLSDGPRELAATLGAIDARLIGLTGSPERVEQAAQRYGVALRPQPGGVDHSSMWVLLDGSARVQRVYPHHTPAAFLLDDLRRLATR